MGLGLIPIVDVEPEMIDEPLPELAERQPVAHRDRSGADKASPAGPQRQALDRPSRRVGPVEHPDALAVLGRGLEDVQQRRDEGVDPAAKVLQVDEDSVERAERLAGRAASFAVEAEHRDAVDRVGEVLGLDHIVLLVAAQAMLRTERGGQLDDRRRQGVEAVGEVAGHRRGMGKQGHALAL